MSVAICIDKVIVMFPSVLNHTTGIRPFLTKDHVSPVHCFVILSAQKKRQEKWCNNALTRNGTLRELVAHQYSFSGQNKTCSKEKLLLSSIDVKIHIILILFIPNSCIVGSHTRDVLRDMLPRYISFLSEHIILNQKYKYDLPVWFFGCFE